MNRNMKAKLHESLAAALPISFIVLILSIALVPMETGYMMMFLFGAVMLVLGMGIFQVGAEMSMSPLGEGIGVSLARSRKVHTSGLLLTCGTGEVMTPQQYQPLEAAPALLGLDPSLAPMHTPLINCLQLLPGVYHLFPSRTLTAAVLKCIHIPENNNSILQTSVLILFLKRHPRHC